MVIAGPSASGKTAFGIELAKEFAGEIISGDSVQVYRGFDIGSGKVTPFEKQGIPHHLIDICDFDQEYTIADFQRDVREKIRDISSRGKLPIIVGGSGLYLKSALYDYELKAEAEKDDPFDDLSNEELYRRLVKIDPESLKKIHVNNRRRLLRAYNYYLKNGEPMSLSIKRQKHKPLYDVLFVALGINREKLYERIDKRVDKMIADGLKEEVLSLYNRGCDFTYKPMQAIGYRQWQPYIDKEKSEEEVIADIKKATRNFVKRQYTWFNHQLPVNWFDSDDLTAARKDIGKWYHGK